MYKGVAFVVIGVGFLIAAAINVQLTREFMRTSIMVPGEVVKLNAGGYHPEIEFVTKAGERVSYPQGGIMSKMAVGDRLQVRYLAENPIPTARIDRFDSIWGNAVFFAVFGLGFIVCGLINLPSRQ
ncbi:hypothetical protein BMUNKI379_25150 [Burkholderia multivorans]|uniref:DUF3592 domain-containing protein n=1 Tax=Burkholderia multivorans TaxID=87883 RepID=UPI0006C814ED|nr:DUF3592 domain-containing protein [Burkholderia multivorans]KPJ32088.1 hypothetical protein BMUNKI379_25150 [Burkholderia multivorans]MBJ9622440.1 DUF3592 domain-containing protein [Burkholderia multivorans]